MDFVKNLLVPGVQLMGKDVTTENLNTIIKSINAVAQTVVGLLTVAIVAVAIFLAFKFFTADDENKRKNAKAQMIYAIIGVIVLVVILILIPVITDVVKNALGGNETIDEVKPGTGAVVKLINNLYR